MKILESNYFNDYLNLRCFYNDSQPSFIPKMKCEDIQNNLDLQEEFYITEKLNGVSVTYYYHNNKDNEVFGVCSKNRNIKTKSSSYWKIEKKYDIFNKMSSFMRNIAIQGEIVGPDVKENQYSLQENKLYVYNIFYIDDNFYPGFYEIENLISILGLDLVPVIDKKFYFNYNKLNDLYNLLDNKSSLNKNIEIEGIVLKNKNEGYNSISYKLYR